MGTLQDREVRAMNMKLRKLREEMDTLARELDMITNDDPCLEEKSAVIKRKMESIWEEIKNIKRR